jgi:hypothetical protein
LRSEIWAPIPGLGGALDLLDDLEDGVDRGGGNNAVAEVEDVARAASGGGENFGDTGFEDFFRGE